MARFTFIQATDASDYAGDVQEMFDELATTLRQDLRAFSGEYRPAVDVVETAAHVEITIDLAGVPPAAVRVAYRQGVVLVVGEKASPPGASGHAHHLVEREFGRFGRAIRLNGAVDIAGARATMRAGELSVVLPKIDDRRGRLHRIQVVDDAPPRP